MEGKTAHEHFPAKKIRGFGTIKFAGFLVLDGS
jgi:hypothetical protein